MLKTVDKIFTDNPFVDELLYWTKYLSINCIVKDEEKADKTETVETLKNADTYIMCLEGRATFQLLDFTLTALQLSTIPQYLHDDCLADKNNIPEEKRNELVSIQSDLITSMYEEQNDYYRALYGLPKSGEKEIYLKLEDLSTEIVVDIKNPISKMSDNEISALEAYGVLQEIIDANPTLEYLNHLGTNKIDPYVARKAEDFQIIFIPTIENTAIYDSFIQTFEKNRHYVLRAVYSDAFKYGSEYYNEFMICLIMIMTMTDLIVTIQDFIVRKDILDMRSIRYIFSSYDVPFYSDIPIQYQKSLIKNLNRLLKYKATTKNKMDIAKIFGFDDIKIFKYYLLKNRKRDNQGNYIFATKTVDGEEVPDLDAMYDLQFVKAPIEDNVVDKYIKSEDYHTDYDDITTMDYYWDGDRDHAVVKQEMLEREFSYERTKYLAIDNVYDMTKLLFYMPFLFNMLFDNNVAEENLKLMVPYLSATKEFKLNDLLCYTFSLSYLYNELEDNLMIEPKQVMYIKGFNFSTDIAELSTYVRNQGYTLGDLGVDGFINPKNIVTVAQINEMFTKNKEIYDNVVQGLRTADNKRIYDIYRKIHDSLFTIKFTMEYFRLKNGDMPVTYTEYLQQRDAILYLSLKNLKEIAATSVRQSAIADIIKNCVISITDYLNSDNFKYIFQSFPTASLDFINVYMTKIINFFNSYKVTFLGISNIYQLDYQLENALNPIDLISKIDCHMHKDDQYSIKDICTTTSVLTDDEKYEMLDKLYIRRYHHDSETGEDIYE